MVTYTCCVHYGAGRGDSKAGASIRAVLACHCCPHTPREQLSRSRLFAFPCDSDSKEGTVLKSTMYGFLCCAAAEVRQDVSASTAQAQEQDGIEFIGHPTLGHEV